MILKYDVYFRLLDGFLEIYQLVPQRCLWRIRVDSDHTPSVMELMTGLIRGMEEPEMQRFLRQASYVCSEIVRFIGERNLFSQINDADNGENPFLRQLEVFDSWNSTQENPQALQEKLTRSSVLVIGAGGVGSTLSNLLTSCGVGRIFVIDYDRVEVHNLARQYPYTYNDVGQPKSEVLARRLGERGLSKIFPIVERLTPNNLGDILAKVGDITLSSGWPFPRTEAATSIIEGIIGLKIPFLCVGEHDVGPLLRSKSDIEKYSKWLSNRFRLNDTWYQTRMMRRSDARHPSYAPTLSISCALAADEIARYISGYAPARCGSGVFSIDPITSEVRFFDA